MWSGLYYRPQTKFAKVMFLHLSVSHSVHGGMYMAGGRVVGWHASQGGMHGRGCAWQGGMHGRRMCVAGGACMPRGHAWWGGHRCQGACIAGGHVWCGPPRPPPPTPSRYYEIR